MWTAVWSILPLAELVSSSHVYTPFLDDFTGHTSEEHGSGPTVEFPKEDWWAPEELEHGTDCSCESCAAGPQF